MDPCQARCYPLAVWTARAVWFQAGAGNPPSASSEQSLDGSSVWLHPRDCHSGDCRPVQLLLIFRNGHGGGWGDLRASVKGCACLRLV